MLRITISKNPSATAIRLEGKLAGPWVNELERAWHSAASDAANGHVCIDLTDVTFVGEDGKKLLETMYAEGARLKASGCATRRLVEEIGQHTTRLPPKTSVTS